MSKNRNRPAARGKRDPQQGTGRHTALILGACAVVALGILAWRPAHRSFPSMQAGAGAAQPDLAPNPSTFSELLTCKPAQLERFDIGLMNLLCAEGLHGSENLTVRECVDRLDGMARYVKQETDRHFYKFREHPEQFRNSLGYYQMMMLGTVLANDLGIRYNPELSLPQRDGKIPTLGFASNSKDLFIHGLLDGKHFGTCASMPVLVVAIGRRLGYPVNLASAKYHLYARYEERDGTHFNIEPTVTAGFMTPTDDDYRNGQFPSTPEEIKGYGFLRPLSNQETLGQFLDNRANCLGMMKRYGEAKEMYLRSARCFPDTPEFRSTTEYYLNIISNAPRGDSIDELWAELESLFVPHGPRFVYFQNRKVQIRYFIQACPERAVCQTALEALKKELAEYQKQMAQYQEPELGDFTQKGQHLLAVTPKSGKEVRIPSASLPPPLNRGVIGPEYVQTILQLTSEDEGLIMDELWTMYEKVTMDWTTQPALLPPVEPATQSLMLTPQPESANSRTTAGKP